MANLALLSAAHTHTRGYVQGISDRDSCRLVALWDDDEDRGRRYAGEAGADFSPDLDAVVGRGDIDGFAICAGNTQHLPLLRAAVPVGKPIFCEKPFTTVATDAAAAMALIGEHGTPVLMGYFMPFTAEMTGVAALLDSGGLGDVTHARMRNAHAGAYRRIFDSPDLQWFVDPARAGGGGFMDLGTHAVHLVRTLLGPVRRVFASIGNASGIYPAADDFGVAQFEMTSGVRVTLEASWVQTGGFNGLEVTGSEATLYNHPERGYVVQTGAELEQVRAGQAKPTQIDRLLAVIDGSLSAAELQSDLVCSADAVAIMEACYRSSEATTWVEVDEVA